MTTVARIKKDGTLRLKNTINERLPSISDGLVSYYPFDSKAGAVDVINGTCTVQNVETGVNLLDCLNNGGWKNPLNWSSDANISWDETEQALKFDPAGDYTLEVYIPIDTTKHWFIEGTMKQGPSASGGMYLGTISYDINKNILPGHPGSYDYFGNVGTAVPTTWRTYNNDIAGGINGTGRTGESTDVGNYSIWHTGTKYARILLITNYNGQPGPTWLKGLKFYHIDADTSNTIITNDGIAIQESTTNLYSSNINSAMDWLNSGVAPTINNDERLLHKPIKDDNVKIRSFYSTGDVGGYHFGFLPGVTSVNTQYTLSIWYYQSKINNGVTPYARGEISNSNLGDLHWVENGSTNSSTWPTKKWIRLAATFTTNSTETSVYVSSYPGTYAKIAMCAPQLEQRWFQTEFVNNYKSDGILHIPISHVINNNTGSISFNFYKNYGASNTIISGSLTYYSPPNGSWWGLYTTSDGYTYIHWLDGSSSVSSYLHNQYTWANYVIVWDTSYEYLYVNGSLKLQKAKSSSLITNQAPIISLGYGWNRSDGIFKNLAIYNRALTSVEINSLYSESFKLSETKAISTNINESTSLPSDAYYFPLDSTTSDNSKSIHASLSDSVAYENEYVWVGTNTSNLYGNFTEYTPNSYDIIINDLNWIRLKSTDWCGRFIATIPTSGVYTISFYYKGGTFHIDNDGVNDNICNATINASISWQKYTAQYTFASGGHYLYFRLYNSSQPTEIRNVQIEQKMFPSAFIKGSRSSSAINYNLNSSIGLDWSGDWTICYWKKPIASHDNTLSGYSIESIGANAGAGAIYYAYWGKPNGSNLYHTYPDTTTSNFGSYFNEWQFINVRKISGNIYFNIKGLDANFSGVTSIVPTSSTACVTSYGYDFKLGGWDNGSPCNAYFRDLIVVKRGLSDTEISNVYKQFTINKTSINMNSLIEEGL